jgi:hypothetical protein
MPCDIRRELLRQPTDDPPREREPQQPVQKISDLYEPCRRIPIDS